MRPQFFRCMPADSGGQPHAAQDVDLEEPAASPRREFRSNGFGSKMPRLLTRMSTPGTPRHFRGHFGGGGRIAGEFLQLRVGHIGLDAGHGLIDRGRGATVDDDAGAFGRERGAMARPMPGACCL